MIEIEPVTAGRWDDLARLFGSSGGYANCWCAWWRLSSKEWDTAGTAGRCALLAQLVADGTEPGLLGYDGGEPVGWVAVGPRADYPRLNRSPHTRPVDDLPVWAVTCFWIDRGHRRRGVATALLRAAVDHAAARGARAIEGYPIDPARRKSTYVESFTGVVSMFDNAGFTEIARRAPSARAVMRLSLPLR